MARVKTSKSAPKSVEPEDELQDSPEAEAPAASRSAKKPVSKADAARAALAEGIENPQKAVAFIKTRFGLDMNPQHFSSTKSGIKKKERAGEPAPSRRTRAAEEHLAPPLPTAGELDLLDVMESMKPLIAQYGADRVKRIVDLLG